MTNGLRPGAAPGRRESAQRLGEGVFDVVGDVHGCAQTLRTLLGRLGYACR